MNPYLGCWTNSVLAIGEYGVLQDPFITVNEAVERHPQSLAVLAALRARTDVRYLYRCCTTDDDALPQSHNGWSPSMGGFLGSRERGLLMHSSHRWLSTSLPPMSLPEKTCQPWARAAWSTATRGPGQSKMMPQLLQAKQPSPLSLLSHVTVLVDPSYRNDIYVHPGKEERASIGEQQSENDATCDDD
jgi:hypothetical protein